MKYLCNGGGCVKSKNICCYHCDERETCLDCDICDDDPKTCGMLEITETPEATDNLPSLVPTQLKLIEGIELKKKQFDEIEKKAKQQILEAMKKNGIKSFKNDQISITYVGPTTRSSIDSTRLKKDLPDIAKKYSKTSDVSESIRIKVI